MEANQSHEHTQVCQQETFEKENSHHEMLAQQQALAQAQQENTHLLAAQLIVQQ